MATPSPLINEWISSYDKVNPLMDLGCAYGINTYPALDLGIPVIALDMDKRHLEKVFQNVPPSKSHLLSCVLGSLPYDIPVPDSSVSGILFAEVLHFLNEDEITPALDIIFRKLIQNGRLHLTTLSIHEKDYTNPSDVSEFYQKLKDGVKWPGVAPCSDERWAKLANTSFCHEEKAALWKAKPEFAHHTDVEQLKEELCAVGFEIVRAVESQHPGYLGINLDNYRANIQIVGRKP